MQDGLKYLVDRTQIVETIIRYFTSLDYRDFAELRSTIADTIDIDFSLLSGKPGQVQASDDFVASVTKSLSNGPRTQHISANHVVAINDDKAETTASLYAWHEATGEGPDIGTLRGAYSIGLVRTSDGWRLNKLHMKALWAKPDMEVELTK